MRASLRTVIEEWETEGQDQGYLLTGTRLDRFIEWSEASTIGLTKREREFLLESADLRDRQHQADEERRRREDTLRRRATTRLWGILALMVGGLVVFGMSLAGVFQADLPAVGLIYLGSGDQGLNDLALQGFEEAQRIHDFETAVVAPLADPGEDLSQLCEAGFDAVIVLSAFFFTVGGGGPECSDTLVVGVDWPPPDVAPIVDRPNVVQALISPVEGPYLAGATAALTSKTGVVGFVGGMPIPPVEIGRAAYEAGVRSVDPSIVVQSIYLSLQSESDAFFNPELGRVATEQLISAGADVVFHATVSSSEGVLQAVREASEKSGVKHWFIGSEADDHLAVSNLDRQYVLASVLKRTDLVILDILEDFVDGSLTPGPREYSLANGAIELSSRSGFLADHAGRLTAIEEAIMSGQVIIDTVPDSPPTLPPPKGS
jgi:basic membrane protein A